MATPTRTPPAAAAPSSASSSRSKETYTLMAHALRQLAADMVEHAGSGHPGLPLGAADILVTLFARAMRYDPLAPDWPDRDRFVLSAGHGSAALYAALHLLGYESMTLDQLRAFRRLGSLTPGHPERHLMCGVETTTGPLGQGVANALGMAIAERTLNNRFGDSLVNHRVYALASDGDLMEGVTSEAMALAGRLGLGRLIVLHDANAISIDGDLSLTDSCDHGARLAACGWDTASVDGHDSDAMMAAIESAWAREDAPSYIACRTRIGRYAPTKEGSAAAHGSPLGEAELAGLRDALGWPDNAPFATPDAARDAWRTTGRRRAREHAAWQRRLAVADHDARLEFERRIAGETPGELLDALVALRATEARRNKPVATRTSSGAVLAVAMEHAPEILLGAADLAESTGMAQATGSPLGLNGDWSGRFLHYGVREHAMAAAMNGMAHHGGVAPIGGTFLVFSDYARPAIRLAAMSKARVVYVFTHDSIFLGEDGPTHQPIEHLASLRAIPGLRVLRPADAAETAECWHLALTYQGPSALILSRQGVPAIARPNEAGDDAFPSRRGAWTASPARGKEQGVLVATGSEVALAIAAQALLAKRGISLRVVSMPCVELFLEQDAETRAALLGGGFVATLEAASPMGWERIAPSPNGLVVAMAGFGASAPAADLAQHFGFTPEAVADAIAERFPTDPKKPADAKKKKATP